MSTQQEPQAAVPTSEQLENIRVAYQAAIELRTSRAEELWSQFNGMAVVQSILLAVGVPLATGGQHIAAALGIAVLGFVTSILWLYMHWRGKFWIDHYRDCALRYEQQLEGVNTLGLGMERRPQAGPIKVTHAAVIIISAFGLLHLALGVSALL